MKVRHLTLALLLATPAQADIWEADFTGTAFYLKYPAEPGSTGCPDYSCLIQGVFPFTASFIFDTSRGILTEHSLTGAMTSASLTMRDETFVISGFHLSIDNVLTWNGANVFAWTGGYPGHSIQVTTEKISAENGRYQFDICPSWKGPCGSFHENTATITNLSAVPAHAPGPVVGSLGGLIRMFLPKEKP